MNEPAKVVEQASQVNQQIEDIERLLSVMGTELNNVEQKLSPVLVSVLKGEGEPSEPPEIVPLACRLHGVSSSIRSFNDRIVSILERIEL